MTENLEKLDADLVVVGAGMLGLAHAQEALRRGLSVVVLEREAQPVGASVRNFGHLFFAASAAGEALACAWRARERWLELAACAGLWMEHAGTVVIARAPDELAVLEAAAAEPERAGEMLTAAQVGELLPLPTGEILGAFHGTRDLRVDPRGAVTAIAELVARDPRAQLRWRTHVHEIEPGAVHARGLTVSAPLIIVCPGPDYRWLPPSVRTGLEHLTLCQLQMLRVAAPAGRRYRNALATGLSLVRYPGFASQPAAAALRRRLEEQRPELLELGIHLLVTQLPDGDLVIGDTHTYGETLAPFGRERLDNLLLAEACALLGVDALELRERWHGIYPAVRDHQGLPFTVTAPLPGVRVVQNIGGIGMTMALGQAPTVLDGLLAPSLV